MKTVTIPCSFDNYSYLIICPATNTAAVVDPTEAYPVMAELEKNGALLTTVLCTHHHHDHIGDIEQLLHDNSALSVVCHSSDKNRIPLANTYVEDGDTLKVGELEGNILFTPGHTSGSICYHFEGHLFVGDTLFGSGCGRLFEGSPEQMFSSLAKLTALDETTRIYFGHEYTAKNLEFAKMVEPQNYQVEDRLQKLLNEQKISTPTTLELEKLTNPFLRCHTQEMKSFAQGHGVGSEAGEVEIFALLRNLRNSF